MKKIMVLLMFSISILSFSKGLILIQGAMDIETNIFIKELKGKESFDISGFKFWKGKLGNKDVVIARTEVGTVKLLEV